MTGTGFQNTTAVLFVGDPTATGRFTRTQITTEVPGNAQTGVITVETGTGNVSTATVFTVTPYGSPVIDSSATATGVLGEPFSYRITASDSPTSYLAMGLPDGLHFDQNTGLISGSPNVLGEFSVALSAFNATGTGTETLSLTISPSAFFVEEVDLGNSAYYLAFSNGNYFGYYSYLSDLRYIYHFDLGYEYVFDADDGKAGVYLYDFASKTFFYTSPVFPFPYLYDFTLNTVLYYYPDPNSAGHYNTNGVRYFYDFSTGKVITK